MGVIFRGGGSGSRGRDFSPPVPGSGSPQPIQYTETHGKESPTVILNSNHPRAFRSEGQALEDMVPHDMPTGGTEATGEDLEQQDIKNIGPTSGDESVFKGAPNTGTS